MGQIIAIGGGIRLPEGGTPVDEYILAQSGATRPRVAFFGTASGDPAALSQAFHERYQGLGCATTDMPLLRRTPDLQKLLEQDVILVGGGNTKSMLALWREWGVDDLLAQAYEQGTVLAGVSAGAICWFEQGVTDSWADELRVIDCLGYIKASCCPHYHGEPERRPAYLAQVADGRAQAGWAICDGAALHFRDGDVERAVCWVDGAQVLRLAAVDGAATETPLDMKRL